MVDILMKYLDCPCQVFKPMKRDEELIKAYQSAVLRGKEEGFTPVLLVPDETLMECLLMNSVPESQQQSGWKFDSHKVKAYRESMVHARLFDGKVCYDEILLKLKKEIENSDRDFYDNFVGEMDGGEGLHSFAGYWSYRTGKTETVVLAEIPVTKPWEIFAWLPFGGWNECPDTEVLMAVSKYWYEAFGAAPAVMTHDILEFSLPAPVRAQEAMDLAWNHYAFCHDIIDQGQEMTIGMLADVLAQSTVWYFWWD